MKFHDLKVIEGSCRGFGSWMGNPLNTPSPGDIFYYKNYQRGGSSKSRGKSRKNARKYRSARKGRTRRTRR